MSALARALIPAAKLLIYRLGIQVIYEQTTTVFSAKSTLAPGREPLQKVQVRYRRTDTTAHRDRRGCGSGALLPDHLAILIRL